MKLSIITINYNDAIGLKKTLDSVAAQTYPNIEHIIVDGGSTDGSVEVVKAYASATACTASGCGIKDAVTAADAAVNSQPANGAQLCEATQPANGTLPAHNAHHQILWISEKDNGIYNAMNKGIEIALGRRIVNSFNRSELVEDKNKGIIVGSSDYIQILNSGDILAAPDVTERMVAALENLTTVNNVSDLQCSNSETIYSENSERSTVSITSDLQNWCPIFYGNMIKEWPNGKRVNDKCLGDSKSKKKDACVRKVEWTMYDFIRGTINHDPTYIRRDIYEKYGLYDDTLKIVSDWKWFVQSVVIGGEDVYYVPIDVTIFDMTGISETNLKAREDERRQELDKMFPKAIMSDYYSYHFPLAQYKRLKKHNVWKLVYIFERVLFKLEKWGILK